MKPQTKFPPRNSVLGDPQTITLAVDALIREMPDDIKRLILEDGGSLAGLHMTLGMWVRNHLGLWDKTSPLNRQMRALGIGHADDMWGILAHCVENRMHGTPEDIAGQVDYYRGFWKKQGQDPDEFCKDTEAAS